MWLGGLGAASCGCHLERAWESSEPQPQQSTNSLSLTVFHAHPRLVHATQCPPPPPFSTLTHPGSHPTCPPASYPPSSVLSQGPSMNHTHPTRSVFHPIPRHLFLANPHMRMPFSPTERVNRAQAPSRRATSRSPWACTSRAPLTSPRTSRTCTRQPSSRGSSAPCRRPPPPRLNARTGSAPPRRTCTPPSGPNRNPTRPRPPARPPAPTRPSRRRPRARHSRNPTQKRRPRARA